MKKYELFLFISYFVCLVLFYYMFCNLFKLSNIKEKDKQIKKYLYCNLVAVILLFAIANIAHFSHDYGFKFNLSNTIFAYILTLFIIFNRKSYKYEEDCNIEKRCKINIVVSSVIIISCTILLIIGLYLKESLNI